MRNRMSTAALERAIVADREAGHLPFMVIGTGGSVGTGAIDPLVEIASLCKNGHALWFHVDGAYGAPAAALPEAPPDLKALSLADSVAVDPHKWLYAPLEAGCTLVRDPKHLADAFSFHPTYFQFDDAGDGVRRRTSTNLACRIRVAFARSRSGLDSGRPGAKATSA